MKLVDRIRSNGRRLAGSRKAVRAGRQRRHLVERLEDRSLLTVLFTTQGATPTIHDYGGPKLSSSSPGTPIYLIFWGSYWNTTAGQAQQAADENAVDPVLYNSSLLDGLQQYGTSYRAFVPTGTWAVNDYSNPGTDFTDAQIQGEVDYGISTLGLPDSDSFTNTGIYYVITPPGAQYINHGDGGYHGPEVLGGSDPDTRYYGWLGNFGSGASGQLDWFSYVLSHETMESFSDPQVNVNDGIIRTNTNDEIADGEAQNYTEVVNGYQVQSFWSRADNAYAIYDGNSQVLRVNNGALTVNGDQFGAGTNDVTTVDLDGHGGEQVTLNGQVFSFMPGAISSITINTNGGSNSTYIYNTDVPVTVYDGGTTDNVTVGNSTNGVQGIFGTVDIHNPSFYDNVTVDDSADTSGRNVTMSSGSISGLAPATITYATGDLNSLNVLTGTAGDTVNILSTANNFGRFPVTTLTSNGTDTVTVGNAGSVAGIAGTLTIENPNHYDTINVDDHADTAGGHTVTLSTYTPAGDSAFGTITGLAPAAINYEYADTTALNLYSGGGNTINVQDTGVATTIATLFTSSSFDNVNVGDPVSVQGILGTLTIESPQTVTRLAVNDSGDSTGRNVTLSTYTFSGQTFEQISGLAPATINYEDSVSPSLIIVSGGSGNNTYTVAGTTSQSLTIDTGSSGIGSGTTNSVVIQSTGGPVAVNGEGGTNTLTGPDAATTWSITGSNAGSLTSALASNVTFSNVENLVGGTGADTFNFSDGAGVAGTIDGGAGANALNYAAYTTPVAVDLATGAATGTGGFANIQSFTGGTGSNTLTGPDAAETWNVTSSNAGNVAGDTFAAFGNLTGGSGNDTFKLNSGVGVTGTIDGGGGVNTLSYAAYTSHVAVNLSTGAATNLGSFANIQSLTGGTGPNTLTGPNATETWTISNTNAGSVAGVSFTAFASLAGGTGADTFKFSNGKGVTGTINGGGGVNTLSYAAYTTGVTVNLATGAATGTGGVSNIQDVIGGTSNDTITGKSTTQSISGGGGTDVLNGGGGNVTFILATTQGAGTTVTGGGGTATLDGPNLTNTWNVTASNAGNVNGISFTGIANLVGGTGTDTFNLSNGTGVTGTINGGTGTNALSYAAYTTPVAVNLATGAATGTGGISNIKTFTGGTSGADTLTGPNATETWTITGTNAGNVAGDTFAAFENLAGGTGADTFKFNSGSKVTGTVNGGLGANKIDDSAFVAPITVNLQTSTATGTGGFSNIQTLVGSASTSNTLIGANVNNTWSITGNNAGNVNGFNFSAIAKLTGGTAVDIFKFTNGKTISGAINGGGGGDWLDYASYTTPVTVNLATGTATGTGGVSNIQDVRGGAGGDTLTGNASGNILIGGTGADQITGGSGRSILIGEKGNDTVTGGGNDDIVIGGYTTYDPSSLANDLALESILAEWQSGNSYATRVSHIKSGGGLNGTNKLAFGTTVLDDNGTSTLTGGAGNDWFFKGTHDTIADLQGGEQVN